MAGWMGPVGVVHMCLSACGGTISGRWTCCRKWRIRRGVVDDLAFRTIDCRRVSTVDRLDGSRRAGAVRGNAAVVVPASGRDGTGGLAWPPRDECRSFGCRRQPVGNVAGARDFAPGVRSVDGGSSAVPGPRRAGGDSGWDVGRERTGRGIRFGSGDPSDRRRVGGHSASTGSGQPSVGNRMRTPGGLRPTRGSQPRR